MRFQVNTVTIGLSAAVSGNIPMTSTARFAIWFPVVTSCAMYLQGSPDTTSANFVRIQNPAGSGDLTLAVGAGSKGITIDDPLVMFPYMRLETSISQAASRYIPCITKF